MYRIGDIELKYLEEAFESKKLFRVGGKQVVEFEKGWRELTGAKYSLLISGGGTAAITCALVGLGIGPGDEVIVPGYTFMATASAVLMAGAIPVVADIDESLALDPADFERRITENTQAVIPVHMIGRPADLDSITEIAQRHGLKVIEDACQMDGGSYKGRRVGSIGDAGAFSFNFYKIISCGEGGGMITDDADVFERASIFADGGASFRPYAKDFTIPVFLGKQLRASEIMGAVLRGQIERLDGILSDARRNAAIVRSELDGYKGLKIAPMNDPEGDCGIKVVFIFESESEAIEFAKSEGVGGTRPIDTGKHVVVNWTPLQERNVMHHPRMNPFLFEENKGLNADYTAENCKKTVDICNRTVYIGISPDWDEKAVETKIEACKNAVK